MFIIQMVNVKYAHPDTNLIHQRQAVILFLQLHSGHHQLPQHGHHQHTILGLQNGNHQHQHGLHQLFNIQPQHMQPQLQFPTQLYNPLQFPIQATQPLHLTQPHHPIQPLHPTQHLHPIQLIQQEEQ